MTNDKELVARLRARRTEQALNWNDVTYPINPDGDEAADLIERLSLEKVKIRDISEAYFKSVQNLFAIDPAEGLCYAEMSPTKNEECFYRFDNFRRKSAAMEAILEAARDE